MCGGTRLHDIQLDKAFCLSLQKRAWANYSVVSRELLKILCREVHALNSDYSRVSMFQNANQVREFLRILWVSAFGSFSLYIFLYSFQCV